ncbi:hypothetical protein BFC18_04645 [Alteromonas confluentis]|uniref:Uncharacterized protein n=1 Tax=Alteromonas confluentis TaxID=1656094 RepID=A0A1E7ZES7_9ALTE|nr:hypothetical protein BFC18_04645 [Alteromonas confluentis]
MRAQKNAQPCTVSDVVLDVIIQNYILLYATLRRRIFQYNFRAINKNKLKFIQLEKNINTKTILRFLPCTTENQPAHQ